jgi:hypothetical protein
MIQGGNICDLHKKLGEPSSILPNVRALTWAIPQALQGLGQNGEFQAAKGSSTMTSIGHLNGVRCSSYKASSASDKLK